MTNPTNYSGIPIVINLNPAHVLLRTPSGLSMIQKNNITDEQYPGLSALLEVDHGNLLPLSSGGCVYRHDNSITLGDLWELVNESDHAQILINQFPVLRGLFLRESRKMSLESRTSRPVGCAVVNAVDFYSASIPLELGLRYITQGELWRPQDYGKKFEVFDLTSGISDIVLEPFSPSGEAKNPGLDIRVYGRKV